MLLDFINLNKKEEGSLYLQLYEAIRQAVINGTLKKGERLPSLRETASQLGVSRTTVETAYTRLCIEGIAESSPQRGYFISETFRAEAVPQRETPKTDNIIYDFSSRRIDTKYSDTELWKKLVRRVLQDSGELTTYGELQGEYVLRKALADYSYKSRGVRTCAENIVVGAGVGPLLNILCGVLGRDITVGIENGGFTTAESIFSDYGIRFTKLESDNSGAKPKAINESGIDTLFLLPSALSKISLSAVAARRKFFSEWVNLADDRIIIEDDYNGELRYTARSLSAFQGKEPEKCIYIGSFSKLLLPSVRIAYMVLPDNLAEKLRRRVGGYNQTCGKIEQLALCEYITSGGLEKHLKKLRRIYYNKSKLLLKEIYDNIKGLKSAELYESSLTVELRFKCGENGEEIAQKALKKGVRVMPCYGEKAIRLCFAGISEEDIPSAVRVLLEVLE